MLSKMTKQKKATLVSTSVAAFLTICKLIVGIFSGSIAVLASAVDSVLDMLISIFNFFAINKSEKPANEIFNYGHGKIEAIASVIEGVVITISGIFLLYQAFKKSFNEEISSYVGVSLIVMIISLVITILLVIYLNRVAKDTNSMVVRADALHYKADVYSNIAVLISLVLVHFTNNEIFDIIIGSGISLYIIYSAYSLIKDGVLVLLDRALEEETVERIKEILLSEREVNTYHLLKTREAGNQTFVDVHLVFDCLITLMNAHKVSDRIEDKIKKLDKNREWIITIHLDPYDDFKANKEKEK